MMPLLKRTLLLLLVAALIAILNVGCQTMDGFGKDVESAGEGIQKGAK